MPGRANSASTKSVARAAARLALAFACCALPLFSPTIVLADDPAAVPAQFRSQHFLLYTDMSADESQELLERLETMLELISAYWGRPLAGMIECYVVQDLDRWPAGAIPEAGLGHIKAGGGLTHTESAGLGNRRWGRSVVYAVADRGTPQHEAVHAYCGLTFGSTGPTWYAEGMAEMGQYWRRGDSSVKIDAAVLSYLKESPPKSLNEIVNGVSFTGDSWQNYAWRWALCHLLANNPNYATRFRPLGLGLISDKRVSFEGAYGNVADQISFEYLFFLEHLEQGYRADLCSWEWKKKFRRLEGKATSTSKIPANRGWQPSGALVTAGGQFQVHAAGKWRTAKDGPQVGADGAADGAGRLMGVVLTDMRLSEPFELAAEGEFVSPASGKLYLRCRDGWGDLADNDGTLTVKLTASGKPPARRDAAKKEDQGESGAPPVADSAAPVSDAPPPAEEPAAKTDRGKRSKKRAEKSPRRARSASVPPAGP